MKKIFLFLFAIAILIGSIFFIKSSKRVTNIPSLPQNITKTQPAIDFPKLSTVAQNLNVPWGVAFLPNGDLLVTERSGKIKLIKKNSNQDPKIIMTISDVLQIVESGLHGITPHPNFSKNNYIYVYYTYQANGNQTLNRVVRFTFNETTLKDKKIIVDKIPGAQIHDGGRIKFGPDRYLYITTGDAQNPSLAQNINSMAGKILRVTDEGKTPPDNPFNNLVYSYGHRNPQGITWDNKGNLWETEHGQSAMDEVNRIEKGKNYGWPVIRGNQTQTGMVSPVLQSETNTWAPSGLAYLNGSLFFAGLRGQTLYQLIIKGDKTELKKHLTGEIGRIRDVVAGPNGLLYITTSNHDGRGIPSFDDDKIIQVNPQKL